MPIARVALLASRVVFVALASLASSCAVARSPTHVELAVPTRAIPTLASARAPEGRLEPTATRGGPDLVRTMEALEDDVVARGPTLASDAFGFLRGLPMWPTELDEAPPLVREVWVSALALRRATADALALEPGPSAESARIAVVRDYWALLPSLRTLERSGPAGAVVALGLEALLAAPLVLLDAPASLHACATLAPAASDVEPFVEAWRRACSDVDEVDAVDVDGASPWRGLPECAESGESSVAPLARSRLSWLAEYAERLASRPRAWPRTPIVYVRERGVSERVLRAVAARLARESSFEPVTAAELALAERRAGTAGEGASTRVCAARLPLTLSVAELRGEDVALGTVRVVRDGASEWLELTIAHGEEWAAPIVRRGTREAALIAAARRLELVVLGGRSEPSDVAVFDRGVADPRLALGPGFFGARDALRACVAAASTSAADGSAVQPISADVHWTVSPTGESGDVEVRLLRGPSDARRGPLVTCLRDVIAALVWPCPTRSEATDVDVRLCVR